jgi:site-specific DNA recombinase
MPEKNSTNGHAVRAAIYARMSTSRQEDSIERQLSSVLPYCEKKQFSVVGEPYTDSGIAGDVFDKRPAFQKLLRDAKAGLFEVIVCDEWSRLSRQEPVDFIASTVKPLKDAGVTLDCVAEGPQRWDDLAQLILMTVRADKSQGESKTRSYRVLTGMANKARAGRILGMAPYGLMTEYETVNEPGKPPKVIPLRFVPDRKRAHVVQWIFEKYAEGGRTMDQIADELNRRAMPAPCRKNTCLKWNANGVRSILKNPRYTGALTWNRRSCGKYHRLKNGAAVAKAGAGNVPNDKEEWLVSAEPAHEALVSQELFDRCQARMRANKGTTPSKGAYLFSGLLTCSHCGGTLCGTTQKGVRRYQCHMFDKGGARVCDSHSVREDWLLDRVLRVIEEEVLAPDRLEKLREEIRLQDERERTPVSVEPLWKRLSELEGQIAHGKTNLLILPSDRVPDAVLTLGQWEQERDQIKAELERREGGGNLKDLDGAVEACEAMLWRLREAAAEADPLLLREVIREAISRVELPWTKRPSGTRSRYLISGGVIHLRPQTGEDVLTLSGSPRRGGPRA